jgi:alpha-tubulin suppressor-like RCC1 family protein
VPVQVTGLSGVTDIAVSRFYSACAIADSQVYCWGYNSQGQLGDGTTTQSLTPVASVGIDAATEVTVGDNHACAVNAGKVKCWGYNGRGQLGIGSTSGNRSVPVDVQYGGDLAL